MSRADRGRGFPRYDVLVGVALWVVVFALSTGPLEDRIGLLEGLWLLGPLVVVPAGLDLLRPPIGPRRPLAMMRAVAVPAGALVVASIVVDAGAISAWLAAPWAIATLVGLWAAIRWFGLVPSVRAKVLVPVSSLTFLAVAGGCLVAWRARLQPFDMSDLVVASLAVHLTFVGFGLGVIADATRVTANRRRGRSIAAAAGLVTVTSVALLVAGSILEADVITVTGSLLLSAGLLATATVMLGFAVRRERPPGATALLVVSVASLAFSLALALQFAVGTWQDGYALSVTRMLELHGTVGGLGTVVGGLIGWTLAGVADGGAPRGR